MNEEAVPDPIASAVVHFHAPLMRYATGIVGDRESAREVVQDTFVRLCEARQEDLDGRLGSWLFRVCRNRAIDVRRKSKRLVSLPEPPDVPVESRAEEQVSLRDVADAIERLSDNERDVLKLRYRDGKSYLQISEATGLSEGNVGFILHRALKSLRVRLAIAATLTVLLAALVGTHRMERPRVLEHRAVTIAPFERSGIEGSPAEDEALPPAPPPSASGSAAPWGSVPFPRRSAPPWRERRKYRPNMME